MESSGGFTPQKPLVTNQLPNQDIILPMDNPEKPASAKTLLLPLSSHPTPGCSGEGNSKNTLSMSLPAPSSRHSLGSSQEATRKNRLSIAPSSRTNSHPKSDAAHRQLEPGARGPDEKAIRPILDRARLSLLVTDSQRTCTRAGMSEVSSDANCLVFCGKIPQDQFEETLVPLFSQFGKVLKLTIPMDQDSSLNKGHCFVTFKTAKEASYCVQKLDGTRLEPKIPEPDIEGNHQWLFVADIPRSYTKLDLRKKISEHTDGMMEFLMEMSPEDCAKNAGCFLVKYETHSLACYAMLEIEVAMFKEPVTVQWIELFDEPVDETKSEVKELYIRNVKGATKNMIEKTFVPFGAVRESIKMMHDVCWVRFKDRAHAQNAMNAFNGRSKYGGAERLCISFAKPEATRLKEKEAMRAQYQKLVAEQLQVFLPGSRIRIRNIPLKGDSAIKNEFLKVTAGVAKVVFDCFNQLPTVGSYLVDYISYESATVAKKTLSSGTVKIFDCPVAVDLLEGNDVVMLDSFVLVRSPKFAANIKPGVVDLAVEMPHDGHPKPPASNSSSLGLSALAITPKRISKGKTGPPEKKQKPGFDGPITRSPPRGGGMGGRNASY